MTTEELKVLKAALATASHVFADADKDHQHSAGVAYLSASVAYESARELLLHPLPNSSAFPNSSTSTQNQMTTTPEKLAVFEAALVRAIEARAVYDTAIDTAYTAYDTARDTAQAVYDTAEVSAYDDLQVAEDALVAARIIAIRAELPL